jgi:peptide-methionine (R)-S-oxide reductase
MTMRLHQSRKQQIDSVTRPRRIFLVYSAIAMMANTLFCRVMAATPSAQKPQDEVSIEQFSKAGKSLGTVRMPKFVKTDAEWRTLLS